MSHPLFGRVPRVPRVSSGATDKTHHYVVEYSPGVGQPHKRVTVTAGNETDAAKVARNQHRDVESIIEIRSNG